MRKTRQRHTRYGLREVRVGETSHFGPAMLRLSGIEARSQSPRLDGKLFPTLPRSLVLRMVPDWLTVRGESLVGCQVPSDQFLILDDSQSGAWTTIVMTRKVSRKFRTTVMFRALVLNVIQIILERPVTKNLWRFQDVELAS